MFSHLLSEIHEYHAKGGDSGQKSSAVRINEYHAKGFNIRQRKLTRFQFVNIMPVEVTLGKKAHLFEYYAKGGNSRQKHAKGGNTGPKMQPVFCFEDLNETYKKKV